MLLKFISIYKGFLCYNSISRYLSLSIKFYKQYLSYRNPPRNGLAIPERQHLSFPIIASQIWDFHADYHITSSINTWTTHQEPVLKAGKGITHHEQPQDLRREAHTRPHKSSKIMFFFIYRYISAQITHFIYLNYIFLYNYVSQNTPLIIISFQLSITHIITFYEDFFLHGIQTFGYSNLLH